MMPPKTLDPRTWTHVLLDGAGVRHKPVMMGAGAGRQFAPFCDRMDAIDALRTFSDVPEVGITYGENRLVVEPLTCVRCLAGLKGWP